MTTKTFKNSDKNSDLKSVIPINISRKVAFYNLEKSNLKIRACISKSPTQSSIEQYVEFMIRENITDVFNFCNKDKDKTRYNHELLKSKGIKVHVLYFNDGDNPPHDILEGFNQIIDSIISKNDDSKNDSNNVVNVLFHCIAGLGRAPIMLAYLMISRFGYNSKSKRYDVITKIREKRRYAFNSKQIEWVYNYKVKHKNDSGCKCIII